MTPRHPVDTGPATAGSVPPPVTPAAPAPHPWDAAAEGWDRHGPMLRTWLHGVTQALLDASRIGPGAHVLDIAAGAGEQTLDIAGRVGPGGTVLATDISPRILARACDKFERAGLRQVTTRVADAERLGLDGAGFDAAVCRLGLMFCPGPLAALRSARAALRPGGRYGAVVFSQPAANPCIAILLSTAMRHAGIGAPAAPPPGSLLSLGRPGLMAELLAAAGFVDIEVVPVAAPMRLPSRDDYLAFLQSAGLPVMALLAPLSPDARRAAWDDIGAQFDRYATPQGWEGPNELLLCMATRPMDRAASDETPAMGRAAGV